MEGVHAAGYVHNDLKTDQVAVTIGPTEVDVTLLDLGNMTKIDAKPYGHYAGRSKKYIQKLRKKFGHVAPEAILGKEVSPASDIFSLA